MSESIFASLPRFDDDGSHAHVTLHGGEPTAQQPEPEAQAAPSEAELELARTTKALKETLASLEALKEQLRQESSRRTEEQISALARTLFPELGRAFLAEEIMRHLPDLIPGGGVLVQLRAEPELAAQIEALVADSKPASSPIEVIEDEAPGPNRVSVSWHDGGVDFDFATLLEACLAQLKAA